MIGKQIHNGCHETFNAHKLERIKIVSCLNLNATLGNKRFTYCNHDFLISKFEKLPNGFTIKFGDQTCSSMVSKTLFCKVMGQF